MAGITAKLLHVDLTTRQTRTEELPETTVRKYFGGGGLAATATKLAELGIEDAVR